MFLFFSSPSSFLLHPDVCVAGKDAPGHRQNEILARGLLCPHWKWSPLLPSHFICSVIHSQYLSTFYCFVCVCVCVCVCACWLTLSSPLPLCITGKTRKLEGSCTGKEQFCEQLSETVKCLCAGFNHRSRHFPSPVTWIVSIGAWICSLILFFRTQLTLNAAASCPSLSWCCSSFNFELGKSIHLTCNTFLLSHESKGWTVKRK